MTTTKGFITPEKIEKYREAYRTHSIRPITARAITRSGLKEAAFDHHVLRSIRPIFSIDLKTMPVTNQKMSGRCWLFAALNLLREDIAGQCNIESFELSQNYLTFWDKFEKANYFLESVLATLDETTDSRLFSWLMTSYQDGGQWDMFINLVSKYGVVPKQAMPETFHSEATAGLNHVINTCLRRNAAKLRQLHEQGISADQLAAEKEKMIAEIYGILCQCFGEPPLSFDWEYTDRDKTYHCHAGLTPQSFYSRFVTQSYEDAVSLIHAPTRDKPFERTFTVRFLNNVADGRPVRYLNVTMDVLKKLAVKQLEAGFPVWFGSDVAHGGDRKLGAWFNELYDYEGVLATELAMSKEDRLDYRESAMNHAMVFTGVNLKDGQPNRWKIQNSWGDENGEKGYYIADDAWFDQFVYQAVILKQFLSDDLISALETEPIVLEPWDPMGTLAD
jgi:bleomycin hydrolase